MEKFTPIHKHLLVKATIETPFKDVFKGNKFMIDIIEEIGMVQVTEARSVYINDLGNEGLTGSVNLATSHIAYHVWDVNKLLMLDVYSCKDFDQNKVLTVVDKYFKIKDIEYTIIDRETLGGTNFS
jgi:S-adenosylmethionine/arginine decarboxylase-like enzyme